MKVLLLILFFIFAIIFNLYPKDREPFVLAASFFQSQTPEQMCEKILEITSSANESKIIINERNGGLGHKSISTVEEIIYALILKKQLWCMRFVFVIS